MACNIINQSTILVDLTILKSKKNRDNIKDNFCKKMGIKLLRISYKDDIGKKLNEYLNEFSI